MGARVRKKFGTEYFSGTLDKIHEELHTKRTLYHVHYDDGDEEDFYAEDITPLLVKSAAGKTIPKPTHVPNHDPKM